MIRRMLAWMAVCIVLLTFFAVPVSANAPASWETESAPAGLLEWIVLGSLIIIGIVATCFLEWVVAAFFRLVKEYGRLILLTNLFSQIVMRVACKLLLSSIYDSVYAMIAVEILVYTLEFLFYRRKMKDISLGRCLAYTIVANTVSLVFGLFLIGAI